MLFAVVLYFGSFLKYDFGRYPIRSGANFFAP